MSGVIRVLGTLQLVSKDNGVLQVPGRIPRLLFIRMLLAQGNSVPADTLAEDVWHAPVPNDTIRVHLSRLRKLISPLDLQVVSNGSGWAMDLGATLQDRFVLREIANAAKVSTHTETVIEQCDEALGLVRGRPLDDVADLPWGGDEHRSLVAVIDGIQRRRAQALLVAGDPPAAQDAFERLIAIHPADELLAVWLAASYVAGGRQADAVRVLHQVRIRLREEFGLQPGSTLVEVERAILSNSVSVNELVSMLPVIAPLTRDRPSRRFVRATVAPPGLVGRDGPFSGLVSMSGGLSGAVIVGEEGVGKTALADAVAVAQAGHDGVVWRGMCSTTPVLPIEPVVQLVEQAVRSAGATRSPSAEVLLESIRSGTGPAANLEGLLDPDSTGQVLAEAVIEAADDRPVVLVIDDLQWATPTTLRALTVCADRIRTGLTNLSRPVTLLMTRRGREESLLWNPAGNNLVALDELTRAVTRWHTWREVEIGNLGAQDVERIMDSYRRDPQRADDPAWHELVDTVVAMTGGNPLFVHELALEHAATDVDGPTLAGLGGQDLLSGHVPLRIEAIVARRIGRLGEVEQSMLLAVACAGGSVRIDVLQDVVNPCDEATFYAAIDTALLLNVLHEHRSPTEVKTTHGFISRVVMSRASSHARRAMHARLGAALRRIGAAPALVLQQLTLAGPEVHSTDVADAALEAARAALTGGDTPLATRAVSIALERVSADPQRLPIALLLRTHIDSANGDVRATKESARVAALAALRCGDTRSATLAAALHGSYGLDAQHDPDSVWLLEHVRREVDPSSLEAAVLRISAVYHDAFWSAELGDSVDPLLAAVGQLEHGDDPQLVAIGAYNASLALFGTPLVAERERILAILERNARMYDRPTDRARAHRIRGLLALQTGDQERLDTTMAAAVADASLPGVWYLALDAARWRAATLCAVGRWEEAGSVLDDTFPKCRGIGTYEASVLGQRLLLGVDRVLDNERTLSTADTLAKDPIVRMTMLAIQAGRRARVGDVEGAQVTFRSMLDGMDGRCHHRNHMTDLAFAAHLVRRLGTRDDAEKVLEWLHPYAGQAGVVASGEYIIGAMDRPRALMLLALGRADDALDLLRWALELETRAGWKIPVLRTRLAITQTLASLGDKYQSEVASQCRQGLRDADELGMLDVREEFALLSGD